MKLPKVSDPEPKTFTSCWEKGVESLQSGKHLQALRLFESAIKLRPGEVAGYAWRAHCYLDMKRYSAAAIDYRRSIKMDSKHAFGYPRLCLARTYREMGKYHLALAEYKAFLAEGPWPKNTRRIFYGDNHEISFYNDCLAPLFIRMGKTGEALWAYEKALDLTHGDKKTIDHIKRGIVKLRLGNVKSRSPKWAI